MKDINSKKITQEINTAIKKGGKVGIPEKLLKDGEIKPDNGGGASW
jgi:hypothetical protein